jgi:cell division protein FtsB
MKPEAGIWNKLTRVVIFLICIAGVIALGRWYLPLIQQNERMRKEIHRLESELASETENSRKLQQEIDLLTKDPAALEREIRVRLGYAQPGETVFRFEGGPTNLPQSTP